MSNCIRYHDSCKVFPSCIGLVEGVMLTPMQALREELWKLLESFHPVITEKYVNRLYNDHLLTATTVRAKANQDKDAGFYIL